MSPIAEQTTKYVTGCTTVAPGHRANAPIGATAQLTCGKGSYSNGATDTCTTCPAGSKCTSTRTEEPAQCEPGTYSNAGNGGSCTKCSKGTFNSVRVISFFPLSWSSDAVAGIDLWRDGLLLLLLRYLLGRHGCNVVRLMPIRSRVCPRLPICLQLLCKQPQRRLVLQPVLKRQLP